MSTKVDRVLVAKAAFVAKARKLTLAEYLDGVLRPAVDRDFREESGKATGGD